VFYGGFALVRNVTHGRWSQFRRHSVGFSRRGAKKSLGRIRKTIFSGLASAVVHRLGSHHSESTHFKNNRQNFFSGVGLVPVGLLRSVCVPSKCFGRFLKKKAVGFVWSLGLYSQHNLGEGSKLCRRNGRYGRSEKVIWRHTSKMTAGTQKKKRLPAAHF
jgi:hypothetical protein